MKVETKQKIFLGVGIGVLSMTVQTVTAQAAEKGRDVPYYNFTKVGGTWDQTNYFLSDGTRVEDAFFCDGFYTYYLMADGTPMKDRLTYHPDGEHVIYFDEYGHEVFSDFINVRKSIEGKEVDDFCFFDMNGYLYVDVVTYDQKGTLLYYANPYGVMERNKWFQFSDTVKCADGNPWEGGGYGYAYANGALMTNRWTYDWEGRRCYMQGNGVALYQNFLIQQKETDHFKFYCNDQDIGILDALEKAFEGCYNRVVSDIGKVPPGKTNVFIYPDLDAYHEAIGWSDAPAWVVGEARDGRVYMVSPQNPGPEHNYNSMLIVAVHEYVHIVVEQFGRRQPTYLNEGIACYEAGQFGNMDYYIPKDRANGTLPSLTDLENSNDSYVDYTYGPAYVDFVEKTFGFDKIISLLEGKTQEEVFGMDKEALNEKWMKYLMSYGK